MIPPRRIATVSGALIVLATSGLLAACQQQTRDDVPAEQQIVGADAEAGRRVVLAIGCGACHRIPNVPGAIGVVGPSLEEWGRRQLIAGELPNTPGVLQQWVRDAPSLISSTGMPALPLSEEQARDVAAFLYTLR